MSKPSLYQRFAPRYVKFLSKFYLPIFLFYVSISLFLGFKASQIRVDSSLYKLFPEHFQSLKNIHKMTKHYGGEGVLFVFAKYNNPHSIFYYLNNLDAKTSRSLYILKTAMQNKTPENLKTLLPNLIKEYQNNLALMKKEHFTQEVKLSNLFAQELEKNIIPDTQNKYQQALKNPNHKTLFNLINALNENTRAIKLYQDHIAKTFLPRVKSQMQFIIKSLAQKLQTKEAKEYIHRVEYKYDEAFIEDHILYFMEESDLYRIYDTLQAKIDYERRKSILTSVLMEDQNLDFDFLKEKYFNMHNSESSRFVKINKYKEFEDIGINTSHKKYYLKNTMSSNIVSMVANPVGGTADIAFDKKLIPFVENVLNDFKKTAPSFVKDFYIGSEGRYVARYQDNIDLAKDFKVITPVAIAVVLIIIGLYFRELRAVFIISTPLFSGLIWAIGITQLTIGYFNLISSFLIAIISGLGVNFGTHLYSRYREERILGSNTLDALTKVLQTTFLSNVTATLTTASGFFVLTFSDFKGFHDFGLIAGIGMLCLLMGIVLIFPTIIIIFDRFFPHHWYLNSKIDSRKNLFTSFRNRQFPFYRTILIVTMITVIYTVLNISKIHFNADFSKLIKKHSFSHLKHYAKVESKKIIGRLYDPVPVYVADEKDLQSVFDYFNNQHKKKDSYKHYKIESILSYKPTKQIEKQKTLEEIYKLLQKDSLQKLSDPLEKKQIKQLEKLSRAKPIDPDKLPKGIYPEFNSLDTDGHFVLIHPTHSLDSIQDIKDFSTFVARFSEHFKGKDIFVASDILLFNDILITLKKEAPFITLFIIISFIFMLWLDFRNFKHVFLALSPLILGLIWFLMVYIIFGFSFNYFNVLMIPVVTGLGIDYGVHFMHRYLEEGKGQILYTTFTTGKAIWVAALQDMIGFSTLLLALYIALFTIGQLLSVGVITCMFASTIFLPALLQFLENKKPKKKKEKKSKNKIEKRFHPKNYEPPKFPNL